MDSNTITQNKENSEIPYKEIYQWSNQLTAEQEYDPKNYFWTEEEKRLLFKLLHTQGNLVAVIGLQGSGKTALMQALAYELNRGSNKQLKAFYLKWINGGIEISNEAMERVTDEDVISLVTRMIAMFGRDSTSKKLKREFGDEIAYDLINAAWSGDVKGGHYKRYFDRLFKLFNTWVKDEARFFKKEIIYDFLKGFSSILIDTPDYDKRNRREMIRDMNELQKLWEDLNNYCGEIGDLPPNIVIFFQKELFQGHFFFGKMLVYEKKPLNPRQMADYFEKRFPDHPFTRKAVEELAALSRGIFRRFKKYIQTCLENYYLSQDIKKITVEHVKKWISMDMLIRDMELELLDIFPKRKEQRVMTVKLLRYLHERGGVASQKEITEDLFEGEKMACSRLLKTLESHGYIIRVKKRGEKGYLVYLPDKYQEGGDIKV